MYIFLRLNFSIKIKEINFCHDYNENAAQSAGAVEYADCMSAEGQKPLPTSVLDIRYTKTSDSEFWCFEVC